MSAQATGHTLNTPTNTNGSSDTPGDLPSGAIGPDVHALPPAAIELASRLFDYARQGECASLQQHIIAGIPPNMTNSAGDTLLMLAAYHDQTETVSMLLRLGADANALNDRGQSPLAGAVFKGYLDVIRILMQHKADVYAGHPNAIDCALMFKRDDLLQILMSFMANVV